jgi:hypothetical protein
VSQIALIVSQSGWLSFLFFLHKAYNALSVLKQKLLDQYIQHWLQQINSSSRGEFYGIFKTEFKLEPHLIEYICVN